MLDFRKVLLALSVAGLGLVSTASATVPLATCNTFGAYTAPILSVEGTTEWLPVVTANCDSTTVNAVTITLVANVPYTNGTTGTPAKLDVKAVANYGGGEGTNLSAATLTESGNVLTATFNIPDAALNFITFTGLRVNANAVPSSSTITLTQAGVAGGGIIASGSLSAAYVLTTLLTSTLTGPGDAIEQSLCSVSTTRIHEVAELNVQENFAAAFKTAGSTGAASGTGYTSFTGTGSIAASQGTRLVATFNNLNANVSYYVNGTITNGSLTLTAYNAATGNTAAPTVSVGTTPARTGMVLLSPTSGSATIYYGVTGQDPTIVEGAQIDLFEYIPSVAAVTAVSSSQVTGSVSIVGVTTGYPEFASQAVTTITGATNTLLTACNTTLFFPYVVNTDGFDTGIAISNASTGSGIPYVSPNSGSCAVTFYGTGAPTAPYNTGTIPTANNAVFLISAQAPGLSGYMVAVCNFSGAHGYAFISDGFGGGGRGLAANYIAIVTQSGSLHSSHDLPLPTF